MQFVQLVTRQGRGCRLSEVRTKRSGASCQDHVNSYNAIRTTRQTVGFTQGLSDLDLALSAVRA